LFNWFRHSTMIYSHINHITILFFPNRITTIYLNTTTITIINNGNNTNSYMLYIVKCIGARIQRLVVVDLRLQCMLSLYASYKFTDTHNNYFIYN